jgi:hypothetical protein
MDVFNGQEDSVLDPETHTRMWKSDITRREQERERRKEEERIREEIRWPSNDRSNYG